MASIYDLKPKFQALLRPITNQLAGVGITANQVTLAAAALSIGVGACIAIWPERNWPLLLLPIVLFVRMALNAIDGMLAREHDMKSKLGAVLNEIGDVVSDSALYLPVALVAGIPLLATKLIVIVVLLAIVSEMAGVVGIQIGASRRYDGPLGKSDRAFLFGLLGLLLGCGIERGNWISWYFVVMTFLITITILNRARRALIEAKDKGV
jgi:CDP-diacylglycerol--glycerol-3-phosphate 3-phosphatidyltransferase